MYIYIYIYIYIYVWVLCVYIYNYNKCRGKSPITDPPIYSCTFNYMKNLK